MLRVTWSVCLSLCWTQLWAVQKRLSWSRWTCVGLRHYRVFQKNGPLVNFDDNFGKYGPILTIFSLLQQEIYEAQKLSYFSYLTFITLPLYLAKQTLMLVSMRIFLDHASKQISMYYSGWNIYLLIYSNASCCHYYIVIVFAQFPFDCPVVVNFLKQTSITCLQPSLSRKLFY